MDSNVDDILDNIEVASPCLASWDDMVGDERVRLCASCDKNVYNFSEMSKGDIAELLILNNYSICGRFYRRADGTIMTDDCPVGLKLVKQAYMKIYKRIAAAALFLLSFAIWYSGKVAEEEMYTVGRLRRVEPQNNSSYTGEKSTDSA